MQPVKATGYSGSTLVLETEVEPMSGMTPLKFAILLAVFYVIYEASRNAYNEHQVEEQADLRKMPTA